MASSFNRPESGVVGFGLVDDSRVSVYESGVVIQSDERNSGVYGNGGNDMRLNDEVISGSELVDDNNIGISVVGSGLYRKVSEVKDLHGINLVVDLTPFSRKECSGTEKNGGLNEKEPNNDELSEKEGEFGVSDLVWGKMKGHPWWPGQIVDHHPSTNSTDEARNYFKKDGYLIAYFGDQTLVWNESLNIKPFRINFCKMANQSNEEAFCHAVDHALHEAARRVKLGLTCSCLPEEVNTEIKSQIRKESSRIDGGGDRFSTVDSFKPAKTIQCVEDLAKDPFGINRLEASTVRGQLSAFNHWKGDYQFHINEILDELENWKVTKKPKLNARGSIIKRNIGGFSPRRKVKSLSDLMSEGGESDEEYKPKKRGRKRKNLESTRIETADEFLSQICLAAKNPIGKHQNLDSLVRFSSDFKNYRVETKSQLKEEDNNGVDQTEMTIEPEVTEANGFTGVKDSYWTDRIIELKPDDQQVKPKNEISATALILKFTNLESIPSVKKLNEIFRSYGPLQEHETRVLKKKNCAKVVFEKRGDAETAFSSSGKFGIFGPALMSYCLKFSPTPRKTGRKQIERGVKSVKGMQFED